MLIISTFTNCFNDSKSSLKIRMDSNEFKVSFTENEDTKTVKKTFPLDFKKELIEFELMTDPNLKYGGGSNCMMIFKLSLEPFETIRKCTQVR